MFELGSGTIVEDDMRDPLPVTASCQWLILWAGGSERGTGGSWAQRVLARKAKWADKKGIRKKIEKTKQFGLDFHRRFGP